MLDSSFGLSSNSHFYLLKLYGHTLSGGGEKLVTQKKLIKIFTIMDQDIALLML